MYSIFEKFKSLSEDMFIYFLERKVGREGGREKHQSVASPTCPNQGLNPQPFDVRDNAPTN